MVRRMAGQQVSGRLAFAKTQLSLELQHAFVSRGMAFRPNMVVQLG